MSVYLFTWSVIAISYQRNSEHGWRNLGEFKSAAACHAAAKNLALANHRCIYVVDGSIVK